MAKDYMCKECEYNKNGWCTERKIQGLKDITTCDVKDKNIEVKETSTKKKDITPSYKTLGSREMLYYIQSQIVAIEQSNPEDKWKVLKQTMLGMEQKQQIDEHIFGIALDYIVDRDILESSKSISQYWMENL